MITAITGSGGGVSLQSDGLQSYRRLLVVALLVVTSTMFVIGDVHCITSTSFPQFEEDALEDIMEKWIKLNPQVVDRRPCDNLPNRQFWTSDVPVSVEGALTGVVRTVQLQLQVSNATGNYYEVSVTSSELQGSNSSCTATYDDHQCGFDGIIGKLSLPSENSNLTRLQTLIRFNLKTFFTWMAKRITILCLAALQWGVQVLEEVLLHKLKKYEASLSKLTSIK